MRVYIPATIPMVRQLIDKTELAAVNGTAFALTPALRESYVSGDTEELEYVALLEAARASLRLMADGTATATDDGATPMRRVVIAADTDDVDPRPDLDAAVVRLAGPVPLSAVASVHVDGHEAEQAVTEAAEVIDRADMGDLDAEFVLGAAEDYELAWYAPQEIPFFLDLLHGE